jgi:hypothetical protein
MTGSLSIKNLCLLLTAGCAASSYWLSNVDWTDTDTLPLGTLTIIQYSIMSIAMFGYWYFGPKSNNWRDYRGLLAVSILIHLILIPVSPYTSNDVERYMFDGKVVLSGLDPYRVTHNDPQVADLRQHWATPEEHAKYPTIYPPGALALYATAALAGPANAEPSWKFLLATASIMLLIVMTKLLTHMQRLRHISLIALSPLLILETGVGAHVDVFSALSIAFALYFWQTKSLHWSGLALGLGGLIKLLPLVLLVPLCFTQPRIKSFLTLGLSASGIFITGYIIAFMLGMHPVGSTPVFFEKWRNASPLFELLNTLMQGKALLYLIVALTAACMGTIALIAQYHRANLSFDPAILLQIAIAIPLLVSPVIFPWYLLPLAVLFAIRPSAFLAAWLILLPFSYEVLNQFACCQNWAPQQWPIYLIALGLLAGLTFDLARSHLNTKGLQTHA